MMIYSLNPGVFRLVTNGQLIIEMDCEKTWRFSMLLNVVVATEAKKRNKKKHINFIITNFDRLINTVTFLSL